MNPVNLPKEGHWIYIIRSSANDKIYIGKTRSMYKRCHQYIYDFRERQLGHLNDHLFNAMTKYGIDQFEMCPWEWCESDEKAVVRELFWMDYFESTLRHKGYNLRRDSQRRMIVHPETSEKIRTNLRAQWAAGVRDGHSEKLKASWANNPRRSMAQSAMFKKYKTKWSYVIWTDDEGPMTVDYQQLRGYGLRSALSAFARTGSDTVEIKGHTIRRVACQS